MYIYDTWEGGGANSPSFLELFPMVPPKKLVFLHHESFGIPNFLTWPMAKLFKLFGIRYLVGKLKFFQTFFFFRVQDG